LDLAGEKVLDSMASPAIAMRGSFFVSWVSFLQENSSRAVRVKSRRMRFMGLWFFREAKVVIFLVVRW